MGNQVTMGAMMQCSFGAAPSTLTVLAAKKVLVENMPAATIMDFKPIVNIAPFGMCSAPSNPTVIAIIASSLGAQTSAPCVPLTTAPWIPGAPTVMIGDEPALNNSSQCICQWGGQIQITKPGSTKTMIP